uniref:BtpA domain containing protein n=1 Tax=Ciona savignyi TaxID=51511 RepID=H2YWZ4_CIOSA
MACRKFVDVFQKSKGVIIGMVHLRALPGTPKNNLCVTQICDIALKEAEIYINAGLDGIMIENMHDVPYKKNNLIGPEITAAMATVGSKLRTNFSEIPIGVQILTAANQEALAVAKCCDLDFMRAEGFVFSHIGDEGIIDSCAGSLLRYRKQLNAENVLVFADVKKKHSSHAITSDTSVAETSQAAEFFLADGVIITGSQTGVSADPLQLQDVQNQVEIPVLVGSGVSVENIENFIRCSALVIGSHFKVGGFWGNDVDVHRVEDFMNRVRQLV